MQSIQDKTAWAINGFLVIFALAFVGIIGCVFFLNTLSLFAVVGNVAFYGALLFVLTGFTIVQPNEARVITFFGTYIGTIKQSGFMFTLPLSNKENVPLRLINFVTDHLKVNDLNGNPIEIGAVIVWRVVDAAQASLNIDSYKTFVANQSDIALRALAAHYPYDSENETSLRGNIDEIAAKLKSVLQEKLSLAGIVVEETKLSHLAYASEIASAMLKRQQAVAIFQARRYMVENAMAIIDDVITHLESKSTIKISDDKKADLINSLLVVMTSDKESSPVLNVGK